MRLAEKMTVYQAAWISTSPETSFATYQHWGLVDVEEGSVERVEVPVVGLVGATDRRFPGGTGGEEEEGRGRG